MTRIATVPQRPTEVVRDTQTGISLRFVRGYDATVDHRSLAHFAVLAPQLWVDAVREADGSAHRDHARQLVVFAGES